MQTDEPKRNLGIQATPTRVKELKQAALDRGTTTQGLFETAMEAYLSDPKSEQKVSPFPDVTKEEIRFLRNFLEFLRAAPRGLRDATSKMAAELAKGTGPKQTK